MKKPANRRNQGYTNRDIVVIAVYELGGALRHIHLEDVAMKAAELAPKRFCWQKYPDQTNLESVRITLKNELGLPNRRVIGSIRDGWMLAPNGVSWCLATLSSRNSQAPMDELHRDVERAKRTAAYDKAISGRAGEVSTIEVDSLLRVNNYFTARDRRERVVALANAAVLDHQLQAALTSLRERGFRELEVKE